MYPEPRKPQRRGILIIIRAAAITASIVFSGLLVTTLLLAMPGNLEFVPPGESGDMRFVDGVLYLDSSFIIGNNGYHDITNFTFSVGVVVADTFEVADYRTPPYSIPVGTRQEIPISIPIDLAIMQSSPYLIFEPTNVAFTIGIGGTTTRGFLDFTASFTFDQEFEALISDLTVDLMGSTYDNATQELTVPYGIGSASFLSGNATATFTLFDEAGDQIGEANETIPLGVSWSDNMTFIVDPLRAAQLFAGPQNLTLRVTLLLPGDLEYTYEVIIPWDPGGGP